MRTKRWMATCVVALLSVTAVLAKDIRVVVFKVSQMHCEKCETKMVTITYDAEKTNVKKLQAGFNKFSYEAEFVKETKKDNQKADKK